MSFLSRIGVFTEESNLVAVCLCVSRDVYAGGAGGARIALHTEFLPSLLSSEGAFSGISDSLLQEDFSRGKPPDLQTTIESLGD